MAKNIPPEPPPPMRRTSTVRLRTGDNSPILEARLDGSDYVELTIRSNEFPRELVELVREAVGEDLAPVAIDKLYSLSLMNVLRQAVEE